MIVPSLIYAFVRARQLDGTFPGSPETGVHPISDLRVRCGWGNVSETDWPQPSETNVWPLVEPPGLDQKAKAFRIRYYQRVRNAAECRRALAFQNPVNTAFEITDQWFDPKLGIIELPKPNTKIVGSHAVLIVGYDDETGLFRFQNGWGSGWGDQGFGTFSYEYFDRYMIDSWATPTSQPLTPPSTRSEGIQELRWVGTQHLEEFVHVREFFDSENDEKLAWTFIIQRNGFLDVEELYVRPQYRQRGYGRELLLSIRELAERWHQPVRFWIPFADCGKENLAIFERMIARHGHYLAESPCRWAAYSTAEGIRAIRPSPPIPPAVPGLARLTLRPEDKSHEQNGSASLSEPLPRPDSVEWAQKNKRRGELIRKSLQSRLSETDQKELDDLERLADAVIAAYVPSPPLDWDRLARIEARLASTPKPSAE